MNHQQRFWIRISVFIMLVLITPRLGCGTPEGAELNEVEVGDFLLKVDPNGYFSLSRSGIEVIQFDYFVLWDKESTKLYESGPGHPHSPEITVEKEGDGKKVKITDQVSNVVLCHKTLVLNPDEVIIKVNIEIQPDSNVVRGQYCFFLAPTPFVGCEYEAITNQGIKEGEIPMEKASKQDFFNAKLESITFSMLTGKIGFKFPEKDWVLDDLRNVDYAKTFIFRTWFDIGKIYQKSWEVIICQIP